MADVGVCPFTQNGDRAGLGMPAGKIRYEVTDASLPEEIYRDFWSEVVALLESPVEELSTSLLICPSFCTDESTSIDGFLTFTQTLTDLLTTLHLDDAVQLVFFHPLFQFRDGSERAGKNAGN